MSRALYEVGNIILVPDDKKSVLFYISSIEWDTAYEDWCYRNIYGTGYTERWLQECGYIPTKLPVKITLTKKQLFS